MVFGSDFAQRSSRAADAELGPRSAFGPGKIIILGEHAAVYGQPVLAGAIDRGVTATAHWARHSRIVPPAELSPPQAEALERAFRRALESVEAPVLEVRLSSDLPVGMGLGSSAALSVAVARLLLQAGGKKVTLKDTLALAKVMEGEFHGTPSGVDHTTSSRGELLLYRKQGPTRAVRPKRRLRLVVALSGPRTPTKATVAQLKVRRERWPNRYARLFAEVGQLAAEGAKAAQRGDWAELGDLMNINHGLLWALGLSSERLDATVRRLLAAGAHGAKLTGAGGDGGAVIGLFDEPGRAVRRLAAQGVSCFEAAL